MDLISLFYRVYAYFFHRRKNRVFGVIKFNTLMSLVTLRTMNKILPLFFNLSKHNDNFSISESRNESNRIIISLTSFPARIGKVWLTIETLLRQRVKPDIIILWLSKEQFAFKSELPKQLLDLEHRGLQIRFVDGDIRSYKKYQYTIVEYPNDNIILVDDDFFYDTDLVENLIEAHEKYPNAICARYGYDMKRNDDGSISEYSQWTFIYEERQPSSEVFFGSGGGTLIRKNILYQDLENIELARELCPTADDVYLNAMARLNHTKICFAHGQHVLAHLSIENDVMLSDVNIGECAQNDVQINKLNQHYLMQIGRTVF